MALNRGLKGIKEYRDRQEAKKADQEKDRLPWFSFPDGKKVKFRPLQEFDESAKGYSEKNGLVGQAVLHSNPDDFRKSAECTIADEGECLGCELYRSLFPEGKGWRSYTKTYLNGLVEEDGEVRHVLVGASKQVENAFIDRAEDGESITDRWWKITRNDKTYTISAMDADDSINVEDYEMIDLERAYKHIPYADQEEFYGLLAAKPQERSDETPAPAESSTGADDDSW